MQATIAHNHREAHRLFRRSFFAMLASSEQGGYYPPVGTELPHVTEGYLLDPAVGGAPVVASESIGW